MSRAWGLEQQSGEYWEKMYWRTAEQFSQMQHQYIRAKGLEERNVWQAAKIAELEFYLSCLHFTGDTVYIDHQMIIRMKRFINKVDEVEPEGLSSSRYLRKNNE